MVFLTYNLWSHIILTKQVHQETNVF